MKDYISPVIANRFPGFIKEEYPAFDRFLQDYLAWLETDENFLQIVNDWKTNTEPSNNVEPYIDAIIRDVGFVFERPITIPKSTLLHFLRDFYLSRGSQQSYKFLFRLLFDDDVRIEYPRDKLLWLSSANYGERHYIFLRSTHIGSREYEYILSNVAELAGTLYGSLSQITSFVESIQPIQYNGGEYLKVEIQRPAGEYLPADLMTLTVGDFSISEQVMPLVQLQIVNAGTGYLPGDQIIITGTDVPGVASVETTRTGGITNITIPNPGCQYDVGTLVLARPGFGGSGFTGQVSSVGNIPDPGYPDREKGILTVEILSPGYNYDRVPDIFAKRKDESMIFDSHFEQQQRDQELAVLKPTLSTASVKSKTGSTYSTNSANKDEDDTQKASQEVAKSKTAARLQPGVTLGDVVKPVLTNPKPCIAELTAHSTEIGQIKTITFTAPYIGFDALNAGAIGVQVISEKGTGATFIVKPITRYSVSAWEDNKGFLEEKCTLLDSDKYQQFSYEIISSIDPARYQDVVSDLLHPVGYIRSAIVEIEDSALMVVNATNSEVYHPTVLEFASQYAGATPIFFSVGEIDPGNRIVAPVGSILYPIVDENGNELIWS